MENASTALIIAASMFIAMLIVGLITYTFQSVSKFAQKQLTAEEISEIVQFNQPYLELNSKANFDIYANKVDVPVGAVAEDIITAVNYTKHVNNATPYKVDLVLRFNKKEYTLDEITDEVQQEFIHRDLEARELGTEKERLRYSCVLGYDDNYLTSRVNHVTIEIR